MKFLFNELQPSSLVWFGVATIIPPRHCSWNGGNILLLFREQQNNSTCCLYSSKLALIKRQATYSYDFLNRAGGKLHIGPRGTVRLIHLGRQYFLCLSCKLTKDDVREEYILPFLENIWEILNINVIK